jgi:hypothetical protein
LGGNEEMGIPINGYWISFQSDENILKLIVVFIVQLCKYTKNFDINHLKEQIVHYANFTSMILYLKLHILLVHI